jgi:hypothetical protein
MQTATSHLLLTKQLQKHQALPSHLTGFLPGILRSLSSFYIYLMLHATSLSFSITLVDVD